MPPKRYNFRRRQPAPVVWVDDDAVKPKDEETSDDETYNTEDAEEEEDEEEDEDDEEESEDEEEEEESRIINIPMPKKGMRVKIEIDNRDGVESDTEEDESEEESDEEDEFVAYLVDKYSPGANSTRNRPASRRRKEKKDDDEPALILNEEEDEYFESLPKSKRRRLNEKMRNLSKLVSDNEIPAKFRVLALTIADSTKAAVIRKIDVLNEMDPDSSEVHKLRTWVDGFLRVPFGEVVPLPVDFRENPTACQQFLGATQKTLDGAVYGMNGAKTQIMQTVAQWIANPSAVGNCIALKGPMGVGKTSFAKHGVAEVLKRPFVFFSLGGASDSAQFTGHSYTYEGATWGRIVDCLMQARCMNPVIYFDELDKVSTTAHGDEIISMLIHLTDRSQNNQFHDRYFAGVDFDMSQCLFVFSFNDESKVNPILRDRMQVINCSGYSADEKKIIVKQYVWPQVIERLNMAKDLTISDEAIKHMIAEYSNEEEGVRILIRAVETLVTRINLLRIADKATAKAYPFTMDIVLPMTITTDNVKHLLADTAKSINESYRHLYA